MLLNLENVALNDATKDRNKWIDAFVSLPNSKKLRTLSLSDCNLTDSNVFAISQSPHLSNLRTLELSSNPSLTDDSVKYLSQSEVMLLKELGLGSNPLLTPLIFHHLLQSPQILSGLEELCVYECPLIGDQGYQDSFARAGWFGSEITI